MNADRIQRLLAATLYFVGLPASSAFADIVERSFVDSNRETIVTGYVLQGSHNMRRLGKGSVTSRSNAIVPAIDAVTVIPALQNAELKPKPRFGYGSDYVPESTTSHQSVPESTTTSQLLFKPVYSRETYSYPRYYHSYGFGYPFSYYRYGYRYGCHPGHSHISRYTLYGRSSSLRFSFGF